MTPSNVTGVANQPPPDPAPGHPGACNRHFCLNVPTFDVLRPPSPVLLPCPESNSRPVQSPPHALNVIARTAATAMLHVSSRWSRGLPVRIAPPPNARLTPSASRAPAYL